jgi:hypothetical protein
MGGNIPSVEEIIEKGNNFLKEVETSTASK